MSDEQRLEFFCTAQCKDLTDEALAQRVMGLLKESRIPHVIGCAQTARELAEIWGADPRDAWRAGILHDVTKALGEQAQRQLCNCYGLQVEPFQWANHKLLHQLTGAEVAARVFGEKPEICLAIRTHTTGCAGMNTLQKIIYIADYMEPNRDFEGIEEVRVLSEVSLDKAIVLASGIVLINTVRRGLITDVDTVLARNYLLEKYKKQPIDFIV